MFGDSNSGSFRTVAIRVEDVLVIVRLENTKSPDRVGSGVAESIGVILAVLLGQSIVAVDVTVK